MEDFEAFEPTLIKLAKTYKIGDLEPDDVAQELRIHLWLNRDKYDRKKPYNNWAFICCKNQIRKLARYYKRQKRDTRKTISLNEFYLKEGQEDDYFDL